MSSVPTSRSRPGLGLLVPAIRLPRDYGRLEHFRRLARDGVAGFLVFGGDTEFLPPFLASLREAAGRPLLLMTDCERGMGQQVRGCVTLPPLMAIGATQSVERAYQHGRCTALEARALGVNMLLAPVADVLSRPTNPIIGNRSFGSNPEIVAALTAAWVEGAQDQGVLACAKHFPGHGDTAVDSHEDLPVVSAERALLARRELVPFRAAVRAGVGAVMSAHVAYPALDADSAQPRPASLSRAILTDLLREELGFGGLVLSDALIMAGLLVVGNGQPPLGEPEAAVRCVEAGCDLLLYPTDAYATADALESAAGEGRVLLSPVESRLSLTLADLLAEYPDTQELAAAHLYGAYGLSRDSLTVLRNARRLLPLALGGAPRVMALLVDDDDEVQREASFRERPQDFLAGFARRSEWSGTGADEALLRLVDEADVVLLAVACSTRAWKGRAGLKPSLRSLVEQVLERVAPKTVCLLLAAPGVLEGLAHAPPTVVAAWGDAPVQVRAAIDVILSGGPMRGLDPAPAGEP